ncbi:DNA polymerase III subunit beta [Bacillus sp. BRMEA1]|uniref:DNA polymerase III subunit beta n=1 Tax=Neobacillus endophyticus TaxID=2738405 RepID=UPI0015651C51|nr:DNA polymerase III subunit beta [Neobacillus endophyticus]NRD81044.1 DNA polymerase III subunit beta [Neobacillus endophyticus]
MKFEIKRDVLVDGLTKVGKVVKSKASLPILQVFLLEVTDKEIIITGSDNTETIKYAITVDGEDVKVIESGNIVIPYQIEAIVKKSNNCIQFSLEDGNKTTIKSGKSEFEMICLDAEDFPRLPQFDYVNPSLVLAGEQFKDLIKKTYFAASTAETRPILQGVCIELVPGYVHLVSTDSHRLARVRHQAQAEEEMTVVVPAKSLDNMSKVFDLDQQVEVFVQNEQTILCKNGQTYYMSRLLNGNYPDTNRLIPTDSSEIVTINRKQLVDGLELIKEVATSGEGNKSGVVQFHVNGVASLSSQQSQKGKGKIDIPYESFESEEHEMTISFDCKYALDALKSMDCETVDMSFKGSMRPFVIKPHGDDVQLDELQLILPVRTY